MLLPLHGRFAPLVSTKTQSKAHPGWFARGLAPPPQNLVISKSREFNPEGGLIVADAATVATLRRAQRQSAGALPYSLCDCEVPAFQINKEEKYRPIYSSDVDPDFAGADATDDEEIVTDIDRRFYKSAVAYWHDAGVVRDINVLG